MAKQVRQIFRLRPHSSIGTWESNDSRYRRYAHELLVEHVSLCCEVLRIWPKHLGTDDSITTPSNYPEIEMAVQRRDQTEDTIRIYSAMAVEGYLNFYGVLRLGQAVFDEHFERLGLVPKLRILLLTCDQLDIPKSDPIVLALERVAQLRNALVHPKTKEVTGDLSQHKRTANSAPETAQAAVNGMEEFFEAFLHAVPESKNYLAKRASA